MSETQTSFFKAPRYLLRKHNILHYLKKHPEIKTFLDVGCGAGELACTLAEKGYKGIGLDFSQKAIGVANSLKKDRHISDENLEFRFGGLEQVKDQEFDLVICCEVLEHIEDDEALLKQLGKHAKGFLFSVPARQKWFDEFDEKVGHFRRYEKDGLEHLLNKTGYDVAGFYSYGYPYVNATRHMRRLASGRVKHSDSIEERTQESGINPIKMDSLKKLNIEPIMRALFYTSLPFNKLNLSEGYLVYCER